MLSRPSKGSAFYPTTVRLGYDSAHRHTSLQFEAQGLLSTPTARARLTIQCLPDLPSHAKAAEPGKDVIVYVRAYLVPLPRS